MSEGGGKGKKDGSSSAKGKKDGDKKPASKSGFQTLGLPKELLRGILNMGYKVPTPVQRKTLPLALAGQDLVCMARTGSGKTAPFLVPLMVHLGCEHRPRGKVRAVVLSPTRELAIQTLRFARQMAKYTSLRAALVVGGDGMDEQFEALAPCPDVLIATPGRLAHHLDEVPDFTLDGTEFVVFDEADRLFEMGFADELRRLMNAMPEQRQCLLFSATMPKALVTFARAGLNDPQVILQVLLHSFGALCVACFINSLIELIVIFMLSVCLLLLSQPKSFFSRTPSYDLHSFPLPHAP